MNDRLVEIVKELKEYPKKMEFSPRVSYNERQMAFGKIEAAVMRLNSAIQAALGPRGDGS